MRIIEVSKLQFLCPAVAVLATISLFATGPGRAVAEESQGGGATTLPFSASATTRPLNLDMLSLYIDSPIRQVVIDGEVWAFGALPDPYHNPIVVPRWKGPDFEHMVRQPDGAADFPQRSSSSFINSGLWYDKETKTLYALMHGEYGHEWPGNPWCRKKTWLVTSQDKGLHWAFVGDVLTPFLPAPIDQMKYSGSEFEMGPADYDLYVDTRGGYFYVTSWNGFVAKKGLLNHFTAGNMEVARCAISDKMAPGKWYKFSHGSWTEPGLGGKASRVGMTVYGIYGNTIYSTYLKRYLRIGVNIGVGDPRYKNLGMRDNSIYISSSTDLSKQDWTPMAKLVDQPDNPLYGFTLAAEDGVDGSVCGKTLHVYNFWEKSGRVLDVTLSEGTMNAAPFLPYSSYSYEPHPESGDPIESRHTKIVGAASPEMHYAGDGWKFEDNPNYYRGTVNQCSGAGCSLEFSFRGSEIYWRAIPAQDAGKADVYLDGKLQSTVDLYFWDTPLIFQFAFIKTGLDPHTTHTIKIGVRGDKNVNSRGTSIKHMAFEYGAESYWASAGFSSIETKNNWRYQSKLGKSFRDLSADAPLNCWLREDQCIVGNNYQMPLRNVDAVRRWVAPHDGNVRIEGSLAIAGPRTYGLASDILKNTKEIWSAKLSSDNPGASHDLIVPLRKGDTVSFVVHSLETKRTPGKANEKSRPPLKTGREAFVCGLSCHAVSKVMVPLPGPGKTFSAIVGVDANAGLDAESKKSAVFSVVASGKTIFKSDALKGNKDGVPVNVNLGGAHEFILEVSDGGNGIGYDWANWADAKATLADGKEIWLADLGLKQGNEDRPRVDWDPVITYADSTVTGR